MLIRKHDVCGMYMMWIHPTIFEPNASCGQAPMQLLSLFHDSTCACGCRSSCPHGMGSTGTIRVQNAGCNANRVASETLGVTKTITSGG
eukprot:scaffold25266_cov44-Attheya_sp.AAC.3